MTRGLESRTLAGVGESRLAGKPVALQIGTPRVLGDDEIEKTIEKFKEYGLR